MTLKAPFPWFGGKSTIANLVWDKFGNVPNYVEPFAGSLAVLLERPHAPGIETVNDIDCYIANFWRALQSDPEELAFYADWPINEADLQARHQWLVDQRAFRESLKADPDYSNVKIAGWWVWGIAQWIGSSWCDVNRQLPHLGNAGQGVNRKLPHLCRGRGVNRKRQILLGYFQALADRLRDVRVCCGDWSRVCGPTPTIKLGLTGVFLDPPYGQESTRSALYGSNEDFAVAATVRDWALEHGSDPNMRIALCGYEGEHSMPDSWECVAWKARGGYGSQSNNGQGRQNSPRERIWFSPHCLKMPLFEALSLSSGDEDNEETRPADFGTADEPYSAL